MASEHKQGISEQRIAKPEETATKTNSVSYRQFVKMLIATLRAGRKARRTGDKEAFKEYLENMRKDLEGSSQKHKK